MPYNPTPFVTIAGETVQCAPQHAPTSALSLDGVRVEWGRDDYISHSRPGTAQFTLFDVSGTIAARVGNKTLIGQPVNLNWSVGATVFRWFSGRITSAEAKPATRDGTHGWLIAVTAAAKDADLGNVIMSPGTWPTETMLTRANRIAAAAAPAGISAFYFYPGSTSISCWPLDVKGRDLRSLTEEFYMSMGDTFSYHPHTNVVRHMYRRNYTVTAKMHRFPDMGGEIYITADNITYDSQVYTGTGLGCHESTTDSGINLAPNSVVSRVQVAWKNAPGSLADVTTVSDAPGGDANGRRTVQFTSWMDNGTNIDPMVAEVLNRGQYEGALPKHPPVVYDTRPAGGFHSQAEAQALTLAAETQGAVYVSGSIYTDWMPWNLPIFAIIGGVIEYDGGWKITTTLQYIWITAGAPTPINWTQLDTALKWTRGDRQPSPSVTWSDFRYLSDGAVYVPNS